jgi:hypothetical protein
MWLSRRWLLGAVASTFCLVLLDAAFSMAGVDLNIDTGDNVAKGTLYAVFIVACVCWCGVALHALRVATTRVHRRGDPGK